MKKKYLLGCFLLTISSFSQINSPNGDNIFYYNGLADVVLKYPLRGSGGRVLVHDNNNLLTINYGGDFTGGTLIGKDVYFKDEGNSWIASGNFGIGTRTPLAKFDVRNGNILVKNLVNENSSSAIMIAQSVVDANFTDVGTSIRTITQNSGGNRYGMQFFTMESHGIGQTEKLRIDGNGNVGIGTTNPDSRLTVAGNIHAQEVKVTVNAGQVPDYVFADDYKLKSLKEVEEYIKQNSHLPEIPSAQEIEEKGLLLAGMNLSLLKKIEEMTLYMIEQDKEMKSLKKENEILKVFADRLSLIEKKLSIE